MIATQEAARFATRSGKMFVYLADFPINDGDVLFSPNSGETFYALAMGGFNGSTLSHSLTFSNPIVGVGGVLRRTSDGIEHNGEFYAQQPPSQAPDPESVMPLPYARRMEYFCRTIDGTFVYVSADQYNYSYESFKLYVGDGGFMRELRVYNVKRLRDGGTTVITTESGEFYSPSPFAKHSGKMMPLKTWLGSGVDDVDPADYDIVETANGLTITRK